MESKTPPTFSLGGYIFFHFEPDPKKVPSSFSISSAFCPFRLSPRHPSLATPDSPESPNFFGGALPLAGKKTAKAQNIAHFPLRTPLFLPKTRKNRTLQRAKTWYTIIVVYKPTVAALAAG